MNFLLVERLFFNEYSFFCQLMNSELAALQEKLEETEQRKEKIDQFLINSKGIYRQQVRLIKAMKSWLGFVT